MIKKSGMIGLFVLATALFTSQSVSATTASSEGCMPDYSPTIEDTPINHSDHQQGHLCALAKDIGQSKRRPRCRKR